MEGLNYVLFINKMTATIVNQLLPPCGLDVSSFYSGSIDYIFSHQFTITCNGAAQVTNWAPTATLPIGQYRLEVTASSALSTGTVVVAIASNLAPTTTYPTATMSVETLTEISASNVCGVSGTVTVNPLLVLISAPLVASPSAYLSSLTELVTNLSSSNCVNITVYSFGTNTATLTLILTDRKSVV